MVSARLDSGARTRRWRDSLLTCLRRYKVDSGAHSCAREGTIPPLPNGLEPGVEKKREREKESVDGEGALTLSRSEDLSRSGMCRRNFPSGAATCIDQRGNKIAA